MKLWLRKITKRKLQFVMIAILSMLSMAILTACIAFTVETCRFVQEYYGAEKCPMYFTVTTRDDADDILMNHEETKAMIDHLVEGNAKKVSEDFFLNGQRVANEGNIFYEMEDIDKTSYAVNIIDGEQDKAPKDGEIWISHIFAEASGAKVGDEFQIGDSPVFRITAIVNSQVCGSGFIDTYPFYLNKTMLDEVPGIEGYSLLIYSKGEEINRKEFEDSLPTEFMEAKLFMMDRFGLNMALSILSGIFGGVGITAAIIILVVTIVVFGYLVRATITKEYKMIGIYKALGRDEKEIKQIYYKAYMTAGIAGMIPGFFLARPLAYYLSNAVLKGVKGFSLTWITTAIGIGVFLFYFLILSFAILRKINKVKNISPLQAMNLTNLSSEEKVCKPFIHNAHAPFCMAVNELVKRPGNTLFAITIFTVSVYMILASAATALTLSHYSDDRRIWENLPDYDCMIKTEGESAALEYIKNSSDVSDYVVMSLRPTCPGLDIEGTEWTPDESHPMVYHDFDEARYTNVPMNEGRMCTGRHEITASKQFLEGVGKQVGEYLTISNGDKQIQFLITGKYSAMMLGGTTFYISEADMIELGYEPQLSTILVFLKDGVKYEDFATDYEKNVPKSHIYQEFAFIDQESDTVGSIAYPICIVLIATFLVFCLLIMINFIHTQNKENRRKYGILKALGFTNGYILRQSLWALTLEYIIAMVFVMGIHQVVSPAFFSLASGVFYICKPLWLTGLVGGVMFILLMIVAIVMLSSIRSIKPIELMEE